MTRLILHIGLPKTGTTSLQFWADAQRAALAEAGCCYPVPVSPADAPKHQELVTFMRGGPASLLDAFFDPLPAIQTIFASAEGLSGHLPEALPDRLEAMRARLSAFDVTLVLGVRERAAWLRSYHQQKVCNPPHSDPELLFATPLTLTDFAQQPRIRDLLDTQTLAARAQAAYGACDVRIMSMEGDWPAALCALLGASELAPSLAAAPRRNIGLSAVDMELLRQANATGMWEARNILLSLLRSQTSARLNAAQCKILMPLLDRLQAGNVMSQRRLSDLRVQAA